MTSGIALLKETLEACSDTERRVAELILGDPRTAVFCTVAELARRSGTSAPAVVRLCKRAGLSGYRELQLLLTRDLYAPAEPGVPPPAFGLDSGQGVERIALDIVGGNKEAMDRVLSLVQPESFEAAARAILAARSVAAFGAGASGLVAYDLTQKLFRLGVPCSFAFDPHLQATAACGLRSDDVAIAVSYSGRTESVVRAAEEARRSGAKIIAVTILGGTPLAKLADIVLPIPATEAVFRQGASMSRITQLVVVDILYATLVSRDIERAIPLIERSMRATHNSAEKGRYNGF